MQDIIEEKATIYEGHERLKETGKTTNAYKQLSKFRENVSDEDFQKALKLEATTNKDIRFELVKIQKAVNSLLKNLP